MRYVVTGAAGFIGSHLAEALVSAGHEVSGVDCFTDYYDPAEKEANARGLDVRRLDLAEEPLELEGVDGVVLRYFTVYGPRQRPDMFFRRVYEALLSGCPFELYGSGAQSRSFTEVGDAVGATVAAMERAPAGAVYNVGGGEESSVLESLALLERLSGRTLELRHVDEAKGDVRRTKADVSRIRAALGWEPRTSLEDGLARMWSWASARVAAG